MKPEGVNLNRHHYHSLMQACARCGAWEKGIELFREMKRVGLKRDRITYNTAIEAVFCQQDLAMGIFREGLDAGLYPDIFKSESSILELDLHGLSMSAGEVALRWWLEEFLVKCLDSRSKVRYRRLHSSSLCHFTFLWCLKSLALLYVYLYELTT